ncbi:MAG: M48 family metallopeptidase [Proteobacteria bacterium]|nr:M48 family metallopeptidase [Pseudomonadota bacterium]
MGEAFGLYTHIRNNRRRSIFLVASLFALAVMVTYAVTLLVIAQMYSASLPVLMRVAYRQFWTYLPFAFAGTALWVMIGYKANTALISWATGASAVTRESSPRLYRLTELLCMTRGMTVPRLQILETPALNAFASGVNEKQYTVTVTTGLMDALDDRELSAVIAHELTHIRNGDVRLMIFAVLIAGVISFFGEMAVRSMRFSRSSGDREKGSGNALAMAIGIAILIVAWFLAVLIRFSLSRSREYLADAGAVELTKDPDAMIAALLKISGRADIEGVPSGIMDMCIENDPDDFADIFSTHPSIGKRVQALQSYAGGLMPSDFPKVGPPAIAERQPLPELVEKRGPWARG